MQNSEIYQSKKITLEEFLNRLRPEDYLSTSIAAGQPRTLLQQLSELKNPRALKIFTGLLAFPYPCLTNPAIEAVSGYFGPIERMLNDNGFNMSYQPLPFNGFEKWVETFPPRVVMTTLSPMDEAGYLSFGVDAEAAYVPFLKACRDPDRLAIAEVNARMPVVRGLPELGDNKVHVKELSALVESDMSLLEAPEAEANEVEKKIAEHVVKLLRSGDTLQFGIGAIPDQVARYLTQTELGDFGVHSELISNGFLTLLESGKISNRLKGVHEGKTLFAFALGAQKLYDFLDERKGNNRGSVLAAPVSYVNNPSLIAQHRNMVSINSGFMVDFSGQICSEAIGERQYSGVGGQLNFVEGSFFSPGGRSILCIKSTVTLGDKRFSNVVDAFPPGSIVTTPRHYVQWVVTEYGAVNLFGLTDEERPAALIQIAHPDFRDELMKQARERDRLYYHSRLSREAGPKPG
ncbi:MAG: acetyl-CoA hydrolase/transferase C-terminal domain-containing protein [bacterium]